MIALAPIQMKIVAQLLRPQASMTMKRTQQKRAQTAAHKHVRGRPDVLDDRELQPPEYSERDHHGAGNNQP